MAELREKPIMGKVLIRGTILCETGLHIGRSRENLDIGGVDLAVVRDPLTRQPYIPGSSLKGKMRALFERKALSEGKLSEGFNRVSEVGGVKIRRHECDSNAEHNQAAQCPVCRLFGATGGKGGDNLPARLIVRDCKLTDESEEKLRTIETGLQYTEWKFENALDRVTAAANPRQLERVPAGAEFEFEMVYNVETEDKEEVKEDLNNVLDLMSLLEDDFLGGHGSRGYGKIKFKIAQDGFTSRSLPYYAAASEAERKANSRSPKIHNVSDCRAKIEEILEIFEL